MDQLEQARNLFLQALEHHNRQRLTEAESFYRQALALAPGRISVLNNLAAVLIGQSRFAEALDFCEQAAAIEPGNPETRANLATCRRELDSPEHALQLLDAAIQADPGDADAHGNRAGLLQQLGRLEPALAGYDRALALSPANVGMLLDRGRVLAKLGRVDEALTSFSRALRIDPQFHQAGEAFSWLVTTFGYLPPTRDAAFEALLIRAIREPWARPIAIAPVLLTLLRADPVIGASVERVAACWPARLPLADALPGADIDAAAGNGLLAALLENATVADPAFEHWLALLRTRLLMHCVERGAADAPASGQLALHGALARQCFINEYVYAANGDELAYVASLRARLVAAAGSGEAFPADALVALACYAPLSALPGAARLLERSWPAAVEGVLTQQVRDPLQERKLQAGMPRLTGIDDDISQQVRQQYEENPYPRWVSTPRVHRVESLQLYLRSRVPTGRWRGVGDGNLVEALNAGCGTGQSPIETAQRIANIRMLAVDLSLASLGYGKRMAARLGVSNIEFAQADILKLGTMGRRFDLIESTGVIHHLQDPAQGLLVLSSLLKDGGVLKLALYSAAARRSVVLARAMIAAHGYDASQSGIRRCREALLQLAADAPERRVTGFSDFYSLSECRDLLFHVQEHRFTIPGIKELLTDAGLDFIGFEQQGDRRDAAAGAPSPNTLDGWDEFENRHPDTFAGMYQFWVQKSAGTWKPASA